jgi:DNA-binding transcriptional LysR family regulator
MQNQNWNDYRILLAIARGQSVSAAASLLGVNATTISRRLKGLEEKSGTPLCLRDRNGILRLTETATALVEQAEEMERFAKEADKLLGQESILGGTIRLTAVPFILTRIIVPNIGRFIEAYPNIQISLMPENKNLSLTRREIDLAIRFGEPREGGHAVLAQRIGRMSFSAYTTRAFPDVPFGDRPWLTYDPVVGHLPQAKWTETVAKSYKGRPAGILMHDLETAFATVTEMPVCAILPDIIAGSDKRLIRVEGPTAMETMTRDVWLMRHKDMRGLDRIEAMTDWLTTSRFFG